MLVVSKLRTKSEDEEICAWTLLGRSATVA